MALGQPSRRAATGAASRGRSPACSRPPSPSISFEFFPPKDDACEAALWDAIRRLESVRPDFVSVTYGAGGTTQDRTVRVTERIARETTLTPLAHLTCVGASVAAAAPGRRASMPRAGSATSSPCAATRRATSAASGSPTPRASTTPTDLVALVRALGDFTVGRRGLPRRAPGSRRASTTTSRCWCARRDAGASFAITQMVFDADSYLRLRDAVAARRDLPITPGPDAGDQPAPDRPDVRS